jgi:EAL domain-containing protein (putative c-di-GMP-specific phosphodiesterase class I)
VDVLEIDRMFIVDLPENGAIADSVITLARNLGLRVIAEGVENERSTRGFEPRAVTRRPATCSARPSRRSG